jgi:hypothetical protein
LRKRVLSPPRSSASARKALLEIQQHKACQRWESRAAAHVAVPGPAPTSSRLAGAKSA